MTMEMLFETGEVRHSAGSAATRISAGWWFLEAVRHSAYEIVNDVLNPKINGDQWATNRVHMQVRDWMFSPQTHPLNVINPWLRQFKDELQAQTPWEQAVGTLATKFNWPTDATWWYVRYLVKQGGKEVDCPELYDMMLPYRGEIYFQQRWEDAITIRRLQGPTGHLFIYSLNYEQRLPGSPNIVIRDAR